MSEADALGMGLAMVGCAVVGLAAVLWKVVDRMAALERRMTQMEGEMSVRKMGEMYGYLGRAAD